MTNVPSFLDHHFSPKFPLVQVSTSEWIKKKLSKAHLPLSTFENDVYFWSLGQRENSRNLGNLSCVKKTYLLWRWIWEWGIQFEVGFSSFEFCKVQSNVHYHNSHTRFINLQKEWIYSLWPLWTNVSSFALMRCHRVFFASSELKFT